MLARFRYLLGFWRFHRVHMRSRKAIERFQEGQLRLLMPYLVHHIPFYRAMLERRDIDVADIRTLRDIPRLPVTSKKTFIGLSSQEYTDSGNPIRGTWVTTSGSTGEPFIWLRREEVSLPYYGDSLHYRFLMRERPWLLHVNWAKVAHIRVLDRHRENHINVPQSLLLNDPQEALRRLIEFAPDVIDTHASMVHELARAVTRLESPFRVRYVVAGSEPLLPQQRSLVETALACEVFDRYGLEETGTIAMECSEHHGLHVNGESFVIEILDENDRSLSDGEYGRVIVTDLFSRQMPIVRYDTGDRGQIIRGRCACGLETPRLFMHGRYSASLTVDGRRIHQFEFGVQMDEFMNAILLYQIAKRSERDLLIRVIPGASYSDHIRTAIGHKIADLVGEHVAVDVETVAAISRVPRGKSLMLIDESHH